MKMALMVIGAILIGFGAVDLIGSFTGFDLWGKIGIQLPEIVWKYSAYIELALGFVIFGAGRAAGSSDSDADAGTA